jgi:FkbM family methyltransferase
MNLLFSTIPNLALLLSETLIGRIRLILSLWYFSILRKINLIRSDFPLSVEFNGFHFKIYLRNIVDLAVLKEVFLDKEYEWDSPLDPKVIVDLGAHFGDSALYFHAVYPDALIYAVEPSPENFDRLKKHTTNIKNIVPINIAVGEEDGWMKLNLTKSSLGHSMYEREKGGETVDVRMLSLKSFMETYSLNKINLLKFDIEGAEFGIFRSPAISQVDSLIGELHFDLDKTASEDDVTRNLSLFKIKKIPIKGQGSRFILKGSKKN